jgi:hypothetical protein
MISRQQAEQSLTKLGLLKFFPSRADVVAEVGRLLNEICADDSEAKGLTVTVLNRFDEYPGPLTLRKVSQEIRELKERPNRAEMAQAALKRHEANCPGYRLDLNEDRKTVSVSLCHATFGVYFDGTYTSTAHECFCGKGDSFEESEPTATERILAEELAKRPGWMADTEFLLQTFKRGEPMARNSDE